MPPKRLIFAFLIYAILSGPIARGLSDGLNLNFLATLVVLQSSTLMLMLWLAQKRGWWDAVDTSTITEDSLQKILRNMLAGLAVFLSGLILTIRFGSDLRVSLLASGLTIAGGGWLLHATSRYLVWFAATQQNPALMDERMRANQRISEKWAFVGCVNTAVILGFIDFNGWVPLSGATVGFSTAIAGILAGLFSQYFLEWKDG